MSKELALERLRLGAEILGECWREGQRCTAMWSASGECLCQKRSKFCVARTQWIALMLREDGENPARGIDDNAEDHPFAMFEAMLSSEFAATGLTITLDNGVKIGPSAGASVGNRLAVEIATDEAPGAGALAMLLKTFRGSKVTKVERPAS